VKTAFFAIAFSCRIFVKLDMYSLEAPLMNRARPFESLTHIAPFEQMCRVSIAIQWKISMEMLPSLSVFT
jgi:hypothetical protein